MDVITDDKTLAAEPYAELPLQLPNFHFQTAKIPTSEMVVRRSSLLLHTLLYFQNAEIPYLHFQTATFEPQFFAAFPFVASDDRV